MKIIIFFDELHYLKKKNLVSESGDGSAGLFFDVRLALPRRAWHVLVRNSPPPRKGSVMLSAAGRYVNPGKGQVA